MNGNNIARIAYGKGRIPLTMDEKKARWRVIRPKPESALPDPKRDFVAACRDPIGCAPLREIVKPNDHVVIVTCDGTRPVPNRLLIPWLMEELPCRIENVTILLGTGTHRPNTSAEIESMFGAETARSLRIINHSAFDAATNEFMAVSSTGAKVIMDKAWVNADKRIVVGFIEPHFFAGFSGGAKGIVPGIAGIETILHLHSYRLIADPGSVFGVLDDNPIQREIQEMAALCPPDFMVNVTLNSEKEISGYYVGHYQTAHRRGCDRVKESSMAAVPEEFPIVVTSNSGFPLDQNLYQTVKGMSAAARIVQKGGTIFVASECSDGLPAHGNFGNLLKYGTTPREINDYVRNLKEPMLDQWQAQIMSDILMKCDVAIRSELDEGAVKTSMLRPVADLQAGIEEKLAELGSGAGVAVLPDGPLTIPYVAA